MSVAGSRRPVPTPAAPPDPAVERAPQRTRRRRPARRGAARDRGGGLRTRVPRTRRPSRLRRRPTRRHRTRRRPAHRRCPRRTASCRSSRAPTSSRRNRARRSSRRSRRCPARPREVAAPDRSPPPPDVPYQVGSQTAPGRDPAVALVLQRPAEDGLDLGVEPERGAPDDRLVGRLEPGQARPRRRPGPSIGPGPSSSSASAGRPRASPGSSRPAARRPASSGPGSPTMTAPDHQPDADQEQAAARDVDPGEDRDGPDDARDHGPARPAGDRRRRLLVEPAAGHRLASRAPCRTPGPRPRTRGASSGSM